MCNSDGPDVLCECSNQSDCISKGIFTTPRCTKRKIVDDTGAIIRVEDRFEKTCFFRARDRDNDGVPDFIENENGTNPDVAQ